MGDMIDHLKVDPVGQGQVFSRRQARMIKRITPIAADSLAIFGSGIEHQHRADGRVLREHRKHSALVIVVQMKKTVPGQDAIEAAAQR
jgi:hypothetical protein